MSIQSEDVIDFAEKIERELGLEKDWKGKDVWWFLGQLVKELRLLDGSISSNANADLSDKAVKIATYAMIIAHNQNLKRAKGKTTRKAKVNRK